MEKGIKCCNCIWKDQCGNLKIQNCEYYDPIVGGSTVLQEYEEALKEREEDYDDIVREMSDVRAEEEI